MDIDSSTVITYSNPKWGELQINDMHIQLTLLDGTVMDEYDILAMAHSIKDDQLRDELIHFLDWAVPNGNDTYFRLRCAVVENKAIWKSREGKTINPSEVKTYLMVDKATGATKIGRSIHPTKRERTLQSEKPTIELLAICDINIERQLHKKYAHKHIRGEWFNLSKNDIENIVSQYGFKKIGVRKV